MLPAMISKVIILQATMQSTLGLLYIYRGENLCDPDSTG